MQPRKSAPIRLPEHLRERAASLAADRALGESTEEIVLEALRVGLDRMAARQHDLGGRIRTGQNRGLVARIEAAYQNRKKTR